MDTFAATAVMERPVIRSTERDEPEETLPTAELVECTCPDFCERDHDND